MPWQVRHKRVGLFMGVSHGKGHYSEVSECCRSLGVYQFHSPEQIECLFQMADSPHLPEQSRLKREDFVVEPWSLEEHDKLLDEGLIQDCQFYRAWMQQVFGPICMN